MRHTEYDSKLVMLRPDIDAVAAAIRLHMEPSTLAELRGIYGLAHAATDAREYIVDFGNADYDDYWYLDAEDLVPAPRLQVGDEVVLAFFGDFKEDYERSPIYEYDTYRHLRKEHIVGIIEQDDHDERPFYVMFEDSEWYFHENEIVPAHPINRVQRFEVGDQVVVSRPDSEFDGLTGTVVEDDHEPRRPFHVRFGEDYSAGYAWFDADEVSAPPAPEATLLDRVQAGTDAFFANFGFKPTPAEVNAAFVEEVQEFHTSTTIANVANIASVELRGLKTHIADEFGDLLVTAINQAVVIGHVTPAELLAGVERTLAKNAAKNAATHHIATNAEGNRKITRS